VHLAASVHNCSAPAFPLPLPAEALATAAAHRADDVALAPLTVPVARTNGQSVRRFSTRFRGEARNELIDDALWAEGCHHIRKQVRRAHISGDCGCQGRST
jgi:hypothetical protein